MRRRPTPPSLSAKRRMKNFAERLSKEYDGTANPRSSKPLLQSRLVANGSTEAVAPRGRHRPLCHSSVHAEDCATCETKPSLLDRMYMTVSLAGELTAKQGSKLLEIAGKCPVHRTLTSKIDIRESRV